MADSPSHPGTTGEGPGREAPPSAPRWAKVFGIVALAALVVAFVLMHTLGGGMSSH
ncbi:hypothetical protein [Streptomyces sp. KR80]|uniref:hypothetical protein n=1 Tax=Streptomyces sp. KR80 TaxID=3457426 RepID=UPI003FD0EC25